ncbi:HIG1 domain-containing protein [Novosphingobium sp.]|uniref:HIG1 domain-containing protein n=1 Tax=Novosphingobium sp. TaxID=1874826 RepID=UPI00286C0B78|nr:HIG1 domain-containing protein [Novosphingobium sp.]
MIYLLVPVVMVLMALTVITLVRGAAAFLHSTREDIDRPEGSGPTAMQLKQNSLMFRRIIYQAAAIGVVFLVMLTAKK